MSEPGWPGSPGWRRAATVTAVVCALALLGFAVLQLFMPEELQSAPGLNHAGVRHYQLVLGQGLQPALSLAAFAWSFRLVLAAAWLAYALTVVLGLLGFAPSPRLSLVLIVGVALVYALVSPPSLSTDLYAYVGFARMQVLYGLNPHLHTFETLRAQADPIAGFCPAEAANTYGPVWTILSVAVVWLFRGCGLWWQVAALKLLSAAALVGTALCGRLVARAHSGGRADLTLLAIGLNPLVVVEGVGNGHNDLWMMGLLLAALACHSRNRSAAAYLLVGLSAGIKFVSAAIVPWLVLEHAAGQPPRRVAGHAAMAGALVVAPTVLGYVPFWDGLKTWSSIGEIFRIQGGAAVETGAGPGKLLARGLILLALYFGLSVWLWRWPTSGRHLAAWVVFSAALPLLGMPILFAWYLLWPSIVSLTRWDRLHVALTGALLFAAYVLQLAYATPR